MRLKLGTENKEALKMLEPSKNDRSGVGVHYMDAYLKGFKNLTLEDGTKFTYKRRGMKVTLTLGDKKGDGLMRRLEVGPDPIKMLQVCLQEACQKIGCDWLVESGEVYLVKKADTQT